MSNSFLEENELSIPKSSVTESSIRELSIPKSSIPKLSLSIMDIPNELLLMIFEKLLFEDIIAISKVNTRFRVLLRAEYSKRKEAIPCHLIIDYGISIDDATDDAERIYIFNLVLKVGWFSEPDDFDEYINNRANNRIHPTDVIIFNQKIELSSLPHDSFLAIIIYKDGVLNFRPLLHTKRKYAKGNIYQVMIEWGQLDKGEIISNIPPINELCIPSGDPLHYFIDYPESEDIFDEDSCN